MTCAGCEYAVHGHIGRLCPLFGKASPAFSTGCSQFRRECPTIDLAPAKASIPLQRVDRGRTGRSTPIELDLTGQVKGGKNNISITRTGHRYPNPVWAKWRDERVNEVLSQFKGQMITVPCCAVVEYFAGDKKRRDVPAVIDSIWHVLEKAGVVEDDCLIKSVDFRGGYDKEDPRARITLELLV